jgi:hypothetical protein
MEDEELQQKKMEECNINQGGRVVEEAEEDPHRRGQPDTRAGHDSDEESDAYLQGGVR